MTVVTDWQAYYAKQDAIRAEYTRKSQLVDRTYQEMPFSSDIITQMSRLNQYIAEINTLNTECEAALEKVKKPEGVRV